MRHSSILQGTTQQMHAAELLKKQGWMFHSHFRKWFHRPNHPAQRRVSHHCHLPKDLKTHSKLGGLECTSQTSPGLKDRANLPRGLIEARLWILGGRLPFSC